MLHDGFGDAAKSRTRYSSSRLASQHYQTRRPFPGDFDDFQSRATDWQEFQHSQLRGALTDCGDKFLGIFLCGLNSIFCGYAAVSANFARVSDYIDETQLTVEHPCEFYAYVGRVNRQRFVDCQRGFVECYENSPSHYAYHVPWRD